jgi:UTP--glucose-1-phosphate uridylyltransferase
VRTAVVPVAGLATRLRPLSRGVPKALLPVAGRPVVQHVVDELAACGIERVVLVTGRSHAAFADYFAGGDGAVEIVYAQQPQPRGLGDAILGRGTPARAVARLGAAVAAGADAALAVEEVAPEDVRRYGIVAPAGAGDPFPIAGVVEKPAPGDAPSRLAATGRYAATPALLDALRASGAGPDGELGLADALDRLAAVVGVRLREGEERFDVGDVPGYCAAFVVHALTDPALGPALRARARALLDGER